MNKLLVHPVFNLTLAIFIAGILISGFKSVNALENMVNTNASDIDHDRERSDQADDQLSQGIGDLKQDTKDIKDLLNQLILRVK